MRYIKLSGLFLSGMVVFCTQATTTANNLRSCVNITSNNQRLACYDAVVQAQINKSTSSSVAKMSAHSSLKKQPPITKNEVTVLNTAEPKAKKSPLNQAQLTAQFGQKVKPQKMAEQVEFTIKSAKLNVRKKWRLSFENGQVWHATESGLRLKVGTKVIIKRGALNSFLLKKKDSNRSIRVKRIK